MPFTAATDQSLPFIMRHYINDYILCILQNTKCFGYCIMAVATVLSLPNIFEAGSLCFGSTTGLYSHVCGAAAVPFCLAKRVRKQLHAALCVL